MVEVEAVEASSHAYYYKLQRFRHYLYIMGVSLSTIILTCSCCQRQFKKEIKEYNRRVKNGADKFYCSLSCHRKDNPIKAKIPYKAFGNTFGKKGNFTHYLNKAKRRKKDFDLDEEYLASIYTGKCALSKVDIHLQTYKTKATPTSASLDRIDSTKGYIKGNVQFIAYSLNLAKNSFSDEQIISFLQKIKKV